MIKNILFDLGGVLLNINYQNTLKAFKNLGLKNADLLYTQANQTSLFDAFEIGELSEDEFINEIKSLLPNNVSNKQVIEAWNAMLLDFPAHRFNLLKDLKNKYPLYLFSNTNSIHEKAFLKIIENTFKNETLENQFVGYHLSHHLNARKPHPESFQKVLEINKLKANETLFIDDSVQHIEGAKKAGLVAYLLNPNQDVTVLLTELNII